MVNSPSARNYWGIKLRGTLKPTERVGIVKTADMKAWEIAVRLKETNEKLIAQLKEVKRYLVQCEYGEEKLTIELLKEMLGVK